MPTSFSETLDLYISGPVLIFNNTDLFIDGHTDDSIYLFLKVDTPLDIYGNIEFSTLGSEDGYTNISQKTLPLTLKSYYFNSLNLYLHVNETGYLNNSMSLFMTSNNKEINNLLNLYLENNVYSFTNYMPLLINGLGINNNWYPLYNYIDMYIDREYEALTYTINLYVNSSEEFNNNLNLLTNGNTTFTDSVELFCSNGMESFDNLITLYTHGFQ